jgi:hypothetical protein
MKREKHANLAVWQFSRYSPPPHARERKRSIGNGELTNALISDSFHDAPPNGVLRMAQ